VIDELRQPLLVSFATQAGWLAEPEPPPVQGRWVDAAARGERADRHPTACLIGD
jgi:hypothetical protein